MNKNILKILGVKDECFLTKKALINAVDNLHARLDLALSELFLIDPNHRFFVDMDSKIKAELLLDRKTKLKARSFLTRLKNLFFKK